MNIHKNARTTPQSRALLVHRVLRERWPDLETFVADHPADDNAWETMSALAYAYRESGNRTFRALAARHGAEHALEDRPYEL